MKRLPFFIFCLIFPLQIFSQSLGREEVSQDFMGISNLNRVNVLDVTHTNSANVSISNATITNATFTGSVVFPKNQMEGLGWATTNTGYQKGCTVDALGNLYIAGWSPGSVTGSKIIVYKSSDNGNNWNKIPVHGFINTVTISAYTANLPPSIAVDSNQNIGIAFSAVDTVNPSCTNLQFLYYNNLTWSHQSISSQTYYSMTNNLNHIIDLIVDASNVWHAAWAQENTGSTSSNRLQYATRTSGDSETWSPTLNLDNANGAPTYISLLINSMNSPHIIFLATAHTNIATNRSGSWTSRDYGTNLSQYSVVMDATGNIYIAGTATRYFVKFDISNNWSKIYPSPYCLSGISCLLLESIYIHCIYITGTTTLQDQSYNYITDITTNDFETLVIPPATGYYFGFPDRYTATIPRIIVRTPDGRFKVMIPTGIN